MKTEYRKIKNNFIVLTGIVVFLLFLLGHLVVSNVEVKLENIYQKEVLKVSEQASKTIRDHLSLKLSEVEFLASVISSNVEELQDLDFDLLKKDLSSDLFDDLYLIKADGSSQSLKGQIANNSNQKYFEIGMQGKSYISNPTVSNFDQKDVIVYAVPIIKNEEVLGLLCARNTVEEISNFLLANIYTERASIYIVSESGELIASNIEVSSNIPFSFENQWITIDLDSDKVLTTGNNMLDRESYEINNALNFKKLNDTSDWYLLSSVNKNHMDLYVKLIKIIELVVVTVIASIFSWINWYILKIKIKNLKNIEKMAYEDSITGLCNYDGFIIEASRMLRKQVSEKSYLMVFDLKGFKLVNEIYGYPKGDELLKEIANNVKRNLNPSQNVLLGRFSNDIFIVMLEMSICAPTIPVLIDTIQQSVNRAGMQCLDTKLKIQAGIYKCSKNEKNLKLAIDHADMARVHSKSVGTQSYYVFDEVLWKDKTNLLFIEKELKQAIERSEFEVYYQPKINPYSHEIESAEALVRWIHPKKGFISPATFIPIAEKSGDIIAIGCKVFEDVCLLLQERQQQGAPLIPISVNLSRVELYQADLISFLKRMLEKYEINPSFIEIEITETTALNDTKVINEKIKAIHNLGMKVSMDDFGTGNSTFSNLKDVEIDVLKIDRSFSLDIESDYKSKEMLRCIIQLAKRLGLSVVCEGIESCDQVQILKEMGCDLIQGYYYAKPMPKLQFEQFIKKNKY